MINVGAGVPFTPERRRGQTAAEWMRGYQDRLTARRVGPGQAAEQVGQPAELRRAWQAHGERHERRIIGRARVNRVLADASLDNDLRRYQQSRTETMGLIARLQQRADPYAGYASRGSAAERYATRGAVPEYGEISRSSGALPAADCAYVHPHSG
jgi:hypothetical protein